jgi:predicted transcriptional regulator
MKVADIVKVLDAEIVTGADKLDTEVKAACGADMMSEVLAYVKDQGMLLTGLCNPQVVRTCEMMDIVCIAFIRGKRPNFDVISLAEEIGIILLSTDYGMFKACGELYKCGIGSGLK